MKTACALLAVSVILFLCETPPAASAAEQPVQRIAIVPFTTGGQENIDYIAEGLRDMIASRVATGSSLVVIERGTIEAQIPGAGKALPAPDTLRGIGRSLGADYLIFGSMAKMGDGLMVAISLLAVAGEGTPVPVLAQAIGMDDVIPRLQLVAREIREAIDSGLQPPGAIPPAPAPSGDAETIPEEGGAPAPADDKSGDSSGQGDASGSGLPGLPEGEAGDEEYREAPDREEAAPEGLRHLLLERQVESDHAPENPVYQESLEDLNREGGEAR